MQPNEIVKVNDPDRLDGRILLFLCSILLRVLLLRLSSSNLLIRGLFFKLAISIRFAIESSLSELLFDVLESLVDEFLSLVLQGQDRHTVLVQLPSHIGQLRALLDQVHGGGRRLDCLNEGLD